MYLLGERSLREIIIGVMCQVTLVIQRQDEESKALGVRISAIGEEVTSLIQYEPLIAEYTEES